MFYCHKPFYRHDTFHIKLQQILRNQDEQGFIIAEILYIVDGYKNLLSL